MTKDILTKTRAFTYILPCLTEDIQINKSFLVNCFLGVEGINKNYDGNAYLVFEFNENEIEYENYLIKHENTVTHKDLNPKYYLIGTQIPIKYFETIYTKYIEGKFSELPSDYKNKILKYHSLGVSSLQSKILYNHPALKKEISTSLNVDESYITEVGEMPTFESDCLYNYMYNYTENNSPYLI